MFKHILIATDGSELAGKAVATGLRLAKSLSAQVVAVVATEPWTSMVGGDGMALTFPVEEYEKSSAERAQGILTKVREDAAREGVSCETVHVVDFPAEAILFDMYYMAKDPVALAGEKRELPKVEFKAVDETTPQFRNFHISNVYCNGAEKAIFVRGLPELHVKNIVLENMVLQAKKGIDVQEASGISFKNIKVISDETNPVVDIIQSDKLSFDNITYTDNSELLFRVSGDRSTAITIKNTDASKSKEKIVYELGATEKSVTVK